MCGGESGDAQGYNVQVGTCIYRYIHVHIYCISSPVYQQFTVVQYYTVYICTCNSESIQGLCTLVTQMVLILTGSLIITSRNLHVHVQLSEKELITAHVYKCTNAYMDNIIVQYCCVSKSCTHCTTVYM